MVDVAGLARLFTAPGLYGEFAPSPYWTGVELVWPAPAPRAADAPLADVFAAAVAELCGDAETVGVKLSGGLDSLAVLVHVAALRPARRVIAYCTDLIDDTGASAAVAARRLVAELDLAAELVVVDPAACAAAPAWSAYGPRPDALPAVNATVAELAADAGVQMLLSGDGADELLAVPRYATGAIARASGVRAAWRYAADVRRSGPGLPGEVLALVADRLPARARARWYWAANWPAWCRPTVSSVVAEPQREPALAWAGDWVAATVAGHAAARRNWVQADAFDSFWPRTYTPPAGDVPEASPFLHTKVVATALALPAAARYDASLPTAYQRCKAAVVRLLAEPTRSVLPTNKAYYTRALARAVAGPIEVPVATEAGLLDPEVLAGEAETAVRMTAMAVEAWLAGAVAHGFAVPGVSSGSAA
ncbi:MAG: asparagine synthase-related protein [Micromonosporaceae bacterium]